jgi:hypothetical protein
MHIASVFEQGCRHIFRPMANASVPGGLSAGIPWSGFAYFVAVTELDAGLLEHDRCRAIFLR